AVAIAIAGQGMALSSDYIVQVAPSISAKSAGVDVGAVADQGLILSLFSGGVAILIAYFLYRKTIRPKDSPLIAQDLQALETEETSTNTARSKHLSTWSKVFAILVPVVLLIVVLYMMSTKLASGRTGGLEGGDGAAFIGGVAVILLLLATVAFGRQNALDYVTKHITNGFVFAFKAMGPVIPIAGFFFLGSPDFSGDILGVAESTPAFLFDIVQATQGYLPESALLAAFSVLFIGIITG